MVEPEDFTKCSECERPIFSSRSDKRYCSTRCRTRAHRSRKSDNSTTGEIYRKLREKLESLKHQQHSAEQELQQTRIELAAIRNDLQVLGAKGTDKEQLISQLDLKIKQINFQILKYQPHLPEERKALDREELFSKTLNLLEAFSSMPIIQGLESEKQRLHEQIQQEQEILARTNLKVSQLKAHQVVLHQQEDRLINALDIIAKTRKQLKGYFKNT